MAAAVGVAPDEKQHKLMNRQTNDLNDDVWTARGDSSADGGMRITEIFGIWWKVIEFADENSAVKVATSNTIYPKQTMWYSASWNRLIAVVE